MKRSRPKSRLIAPKKPTIPKGKHPKEGKDKKEPPFYVKYWT